MMNTFELVFDEQCAPIDVRSIHRFVIVLKNAVDKGDIGIGY